MKNGILHPFIPLPKSGVAINWMGLPNPGHSKVAKILSRIEKIRGCPVGASIAADPDASEDERAEGLITGLMQYEKAGIDFIELNESCPNVEAHKNSGDTGMDVMDRLEIISNEFLKKRTRYFPVIVKFSLDMHRKDLPAILDALADMGFDGVNTGNTSTSYREIVDEIDKDEKEVFEYFTGKFGGGVSGNALKERSLELAAAAAEYINSKDLKREFHVIRTGGVESFSDVNISTKKGISLCQWFTGYFEDFAKHGHRLYTEMFKNEEE
jgi:dihydroorotate dehydrogenase (NAD+) catalytic subunit